MIIENFLSNGTKLTSLSQAITSLKDVNAFGLFLEIGANRAAPQPSSTPIETAALSSAWHAGYKEALNDVFYFFERYTKTDNQRPRADFGALDSMIKEGTITEDERAKYFDTNGIDR